jgi:hypothetical protein
MPPAQRLLDADWDYCVVLDACRYDVFADVYGDYFDGEVEKRRSPGSSTPEWASRTFTGEHDIAYFSGNPFINDLGIPLVDLEWGASCNYEWTANQHLSHVVDVWKHGWDDDLGTVPPDGIETAFDQYRHLADEAERTVIHYMQPHAPYLRRGNGRKLEHIQKSMRRRADGDDGGSVLDPILDRVRPKVEGYLDGNGLAQMVGLWLELDLEGLLTDGTRQTAMTYHEENLRIALESVASMVDDLEGTVVVTADHGEAFGEHGVWEHHIETHIPPLVEVPWLELP